MALAEAAWKRDTVPTERAAKLTVFTLWMTHLEIASPCGYIGICFRIFLLANLVPLDSIDRRVKLAVSTSPYGKYHTMKACTASAYGE